MSDKNFREETVRPLLEVVSVVIVFIVMASIFDGLIGFIATVIYCSAEYHKKGGDLLLQLFYPEDKDGKD